MVGVEWSLILKQILKLKKDTNTINDKKKMIQKWWINDNILILLYIKVIFYIIKRKFIELKFIKIIYTF